MKTTVIEISGEPMHFREPRVPGPRNKPAYQMLQQDFADVKAFHWPLLVMGAAYVPGADERDVDATREFAEIARKNDYVFFDAFQAFVTAFVEFFRQEYERSSS